MRIWSREDDDYFDATYGGSTAVIPPPVQKEQPLTRVEKGELARQRRVQMRKLIAEGDMTKVLTSWRDDVELRCPAGKNGKPRRLMMMDMIARALGHTTTLHVELHKDGSITTRAVAGSTVEDGKVLLGARTKHEAS